MTVGVLCAPPTIPAEVLLTIDHFWAVLRPTRHLLSVLATCALLLALAGCSVFGTTRAGPRHLVIATLFAASGADAITQLPAQYGVDLAVSQAHLPGGYTLSVVHEDDESTDGSGPDTTIAATEATSLVNNASVVAIVGPFLNAIANVTMPITNAAGLTMISPTTTNPGLTLEPYAPEYGLTWSRLHPVGHPNRYFQTSANDVEQGQLDAYFARHVLGARTVFVTDDETTYGATLANSFATAFASTAGQRVVAFTPFNDYAQTYNFQALAGSILALHPDLVFYGGVTSSGGASLKGALVLAGYTKPLLGGDGIANDPNWLANAGYGTGFGVADTYGTVAAPDVSVLTSRRAKQFVSAYETYYFANPPLTALPTPNAITAITTPDGQLLSQIPTPYSVMAYDATNTLIAALSQAIQQGAGRSLSDLRTQTGAVLASPRFQYSGLTGTITFDRNGDNVGQRIFSVYEVSSSADTAPQWYVFQLYQCSGGTTLSCQTISHL